jgi:GT2 family glycosyltransferase
MSSFKAASSNVVAVVVTHNRPKLLKMALEALRLQTVHLEDIVVVDNASDRETVELLEYEQGLKVVRMEHNTGGSGGFAAGAEQALVMAPEWIWLLDDDVIMQDDALENLLGKDGDLVYCPKDVAVLCPAVEEGGRLALMHRRYFDPSTLREQTVPRQLYDSAVVEIDTASFVGFLVRADAIRRVGVPDARFFLSYDDAEFSLRLKSVGYRLWLRPASRANHRRPRNARLRRGPFGLRHYYNLRNRMIIYRKFGDAPAWRWVSPLAQSLMLLLIAGKGRPAAFKWWWRAMRDSLGEPHVVREAGAREVGGR